MVKASRENYRHQRSKDRSGHVAMTDTPRQSGCLLLVHEGQEKRVGWVRSSAEISATIDGFRPRPQTRRRDHLRESCDSPALDAPCLQKRGRGGCRGVRVFSHHRTREDVAVVGTSEPGKTTLLNLIAGPAPGFGAAKDGSWATH
jgi:hypothetical protein